MRLLLTISIFLMLAFFIIISPANVWASEMENAKAYYAAELAQCTAYFSLYGSALDERGEKEGAREAGKQADKAFKMAVELSNRAAVNARVKIELKEMFKSIKGKYSHISRLVAMYAGTCRAVVENPDERLRYWLQKKPQARK